MAHNQFQRERDLFYEGPVVLFQWREHPATEVVYVSANVKRIFGFDADEFLSGQRSFLQLIAPQDREVYQQELNSIAASQLERLEHKPFRVETAQGEILWVSAYTALLHDDTGTTTHYLTYLIDQTERLRAEQALKVSEQRYHQMFQTNQAIKLLIDPSNGRIMEANQAAVMFYGYPLERLTQLRIMDINMLSSDEVALEMERAKTEERLFFNFRHRLASGEIRDVEVYSGPVTTPQGSLLYSIIHDVTERNRAQQSLEDSLQHLAQTLTELKATQEQLVQRERLAAVGQLTTGIAHDFNNILTGILGFAEMLQISPSLPEELREDVTQIIQSGDRAATLIRQLLDFSRKSIREFTQIDLLPLLDEAVTFLRRTIPVNIHLSKEVQPNEYILQADPTQLQQIMTNLAVNARDAMPAGGKLNISLSRTTLDGSLACSLCQQPIQGEFIQLRIHDTGTGIPPEVKPHIFEPFFTTKAAGKGSGLGLAQVAGIVAQHQGHLTVTSDPSQGTTFTLYFLPSADNKISQQPPVQQPIPGQQEVVLLVEDDPTVQKITNIMLTRLNYQVLLADSAEEALEVFAQHKHQIRLVLSDMVMPGMDGVSLLQSLREQEPEIKILFMSGYPLGEQDQELQHLGVNGWLQKPMSLLQLSLALRKALTAPQQA